MLVPIREEQQAFGMLFRTRDLLVRQRTQTVNALRGHLAEFGVIAPKGLAHVVRLASAVAAQDSGLPETVHEPSRLLLGRIAGLNREIDKLERRIRSGAYEDEEARRLMSIPGIGPICASAILAFAPPMESFRSGRDFSAWLVAGPYAGRGGAGQQDGAHRLGAGDEEGILQGSCAGHLSGGRIQPGGMQAGRRIT